MQNVANLLQSSVEASRGKKVWMRVKGIASVAHLLTIQCGRIWDRAKRKTKAKAATMLRTGREPVDSAQCYHHSSCNLNLTNIPFHNSNEDILSRIGSRDCWLIIITILFRFVYFYLRKRANDLQIDVELKNSHFHQHRFSFLE